MKSNYLYTLVLFIIYELISNVSNLFQKVVLFVFGLVLLVIWMVFTYMKYHRKQVAIYENVEIKLELRKRWFQYIFIPLVYFISTSVLLFFVQALIFKQFLVLSSVICFYYIFYFTQVSYTNQFVVDKYMRMVTDVISTILFYSIALLLSISGYVPVYFISLAIGLYTVLALFASMYSAGIVGLSGFFLSILAGLIMGVASILLLPVSLMTFPFVLTLIFYLILSFWHLKMNGEYRLEKYLVPVLFIAMSLIIVLS